MQKDIGVFVHNRIYELMKSKKISARTMSELIGCNPNYLNSMVHRGYIPALPKIQAICDYFGISLSEFFMPDYSDNKGLSSILQILSNGYDDETISLLYGFIQSFDSSELKAFLKLYSKNRK